MESFEFIESGIVFGLESPKALRQFRYTTKDFAIHGDAYEFVLKKIKKFKPEFILLSAGFDAHKDDPLAQLQLTSKDFYNLTKRTLNLAKLYCEGKVVSILEGGYDLNALKESVDYHVKSLMEQK